MILYLLLLLCAVLIGTFTIVLLVGWNRQYRLLNFSIAIGLGIGICSNLYFLALLLMPDKSIHVAMSLCTALCAALGLATFRAGKSTPWTTGNETMNSQASGTQALQIAFYVLLAAAMLAFCCQCMLHPHSDSDAVMIWDLHARFLERGGTHWKDTFSPLIFWSHPDYPLLIPGIVAMGLTLLSENQLAATAPAFTFTFATVTLLVAALSVLRSKMHGLIAGIILLTTPLWISTGTLLFADVPLAFFMLAAMVCCALYDATKRGGYLCLAGMLAGMAAWTKNEGLLYIPVLLVASCLANRRLLPSKRSIAACLLGIMPFMIVLTIFKMTMAPINDLMAGQGAGLTLARIQEPMRIPLIAQSFILYAFEFGNWVITPVPFFLVAWLLSKPHIDSIASRRVLWTMCLMLSGYALIFWISPVNLNFQLTTAAPRLFLQLWPLTLMGTIMQLRFGHEQKHQIGAGADGDTG